MLKTLRQAILIFMDRKNVIYVIFAVVLVTAAILWNILGSKDNGNNEAVQSPAAPEYVEPQSQPAFPLVGSAPTTPSSTLGALTPPRTGAE